MVGAKRRILSARNIPARDNRSDGRYSEPASLLVFFALFILVFWAGWIAAVRVTERYIVRQN